MGASPDVANRRRCRIFRPTFAAILLMVKRSSSPRIYYTTTLSRVLAYDLMQDLYYQAVQKCPTILQ